MNINWRVRIKNPLFWIGLIGAIGTTVLAYFNIAATDLTTWDSLFDVIAKTFQNPYLLGSVFFTILSFIGVITDPTTKGITDSARALTYTEPKGDEDADVS